MSYADIVKNKLANDREIDIIRSQAETELRRVLQKEEESLLLTRFTPNRLCSQINKVWSNEITLYSMIFSVWIWSSEIFSDAVSEARIRLLHISQFYTTRWKLSHSR